MSTTSDKTAVHERGFQLQNVHWLWLSAIVIVADQITKQLVVNNLELFDRIHIFDWLNLTLMHNTGAAFSMLAGTTPWFFVALSVVVAIGILIWMRRHPHEERLVAASLALILGGALGNAIDRATRGFVVDFVDFHLQTWHYPAFNVADSAIVLGAILLGLDMLRPRHRRDERPNKE